jgi:phosphoglucosamine mutase
MALFGTDGIRGRVGVAPITADHVVRLGRAVGAVLKREGLATVVIGKDTRISCYMFESALEAGLISAGVSVKLLGPMPTPAVAMLTQSLRADLGVVISASHNPYHDNGIKFFSRDGEKISDALEAAIEAEYAQPFATVESAELGRAERVSDAGGRYIEFCKASVPDALSLKGLHVVLDCAHGATYSVAPRVFRELGARVDARFVEPNGLNINADCGSTHPRALIDAVRSTGAGLGIAFDGDGDRVLMVDGRGELIDGDALLYVLARAWQANGRLRGPVVGTVMTNLGCEQALAELGIAFERASVGDRYVHQRLRERGGVLGGETSGHLLCLDRANTGDAIVAALQVLEVIVDNRASLAELAQAMPRYPQRMINVRLAKKLKLDDAPEVRAARDSAELALAGKGRIILRASGTEPVYRVTVEGADGAQVDACAEAIAAAVRAAAARLA